MGLITSITAQEDFPRVDLTPDNTGMLAVMLSSRDFLEAGHDRAEEAVLLYRLGHPAVMRAAGREFLNNAGQAGAFRTGIAAFEVAMMLINGRGIYNPDAVKVCTSAVAVIRPERFLDLLLETDTAFRELMPNTCEVVAEAAKRDYPSLVTHAIAGAAFARQLELEVEKFNLALEPPIWD